MSNFKILFLVTGLMFPLVSLSEGKSVDELARELANPNTPLASLKLKIQHRWYKGDLPGADDEHNTMLLFQPSLPFPLDNGDKIIFRPAVPLQIDQPIFEPKNLKFDSESGMGDIGFDLVYAQTSETGLLTAFGLVGTLPTATEDELGKDRWAFGPEIFIGKISKKSVIGMFPSHQWDVAGSGDADISLSSLQLFGVYLPNGGWNVGTSPIFTYDHETNEASIPLNIAVGKTIIANGRPWKLGMEINYYVEQPDAFGPKWMVSFEVTPVVKNALASWFK
jgi:hypothetical protein